MMRVKAMSGNTFETIIKNRLEKPEPINAQAEK